MGTAAWNAHKGAPATAFDSVSLRFTRGKARKKLYMAAVLKGALPAPALQKCTARPCVYDLPSTCTCKTHCIDRSATRTRTVLGATKSVKTGTNLPTDLIRFHFSHLI